MRKDGWLLGLLVGLGLGMALSPTFGRNPAGGATGRLEGVVWGPGKRPVAGAVLAIVATTSTARMEDVAPLTDPHGRFRFRPLPPGSYTVRASARGYEPETRKVAVRPGRRTEVQFLLKPLLH